MKSTTILLFVIPLNFMVAFGTEYHVSVKGNDQNDGSAARPFKTIAKAVEHAYAGDTITVHAGTYRERINPIRGGESDDKRIVYRGTSGERVEIKGSEAIKKWEKASGSVWKVTLPNSFFGDYNPYKDSIFGDWFHDWDRIHHTGEVFLNGKSLYEDVALEELYNPVPNEKLIDPEGSTYTWYCESNDSTTTIWANFHRYNPNEELVEISTRSTCFYPDKPGLNYITISGFHFSQAATQWAAPTAEQVGMVATHWNKGWIIENNVISESKCSGITLGKDRSTGHNVWSEDVGSINRDGNIHYIEVVFRTLRNGWNKENIGSHIVRKNEIFHCGQAGICGSMGAGFSTIENNHIHHIYTKRQYGGYEMGGIKFHAAIDATIRNNRIHNCDRGLWLDWMTQGTRVSSNLFYENDAEDIFFEVNHGPFIVDNNIFLSANAISTQSEGGAFIHNLIAGTLKIRSDLRRFTPYHLPHSTAVKALVTIRSGDDRFYNNVFVKSRELSDKEKDIYGYHKYKETKYPVWIDANSYYNGAVPYHKEQNYTEKQDFDPNIQLIEEEDGMYLSFIVDDAPAYKLPMITTEMLGKTIVPKQGFENPDGTPMTIDRDYFGNVRTAQNNTVGPFSHLQKAGAVKLKVW